MSRALPPLNIEVAPHPEDHTMWGWSFLSDAGRVLFRGEAAFLDDLDCFNEAKAIRARFAANAAQVDSYVS